MANDNNDLVKHWAHPGGSGNRRPMTGAELAQAKADWAQQEAVCKDILLSDGRAETLDSWMEYCQHCFNEYDEGPFPEDASGGSTR